MAFGFPPRYTETFRPNDSTVDVQVAVRAALDALSWAWRQTPDGSITVSRGVNALTWGETISISFHPDGDVSVASRCSFQLQCCDWGRNKANVRQFLTALRSLVESSRAP